MGKVVRKTIEFKRRYDQEELSTLIFCLEEVLHAYSACERSHDAVVDCVTDLLADLRLFLPEGSNREEQRG